MNAFICMIIGGGYAGIHAAKAMRNTLEGKFGIRPLRIILIDRQLHHTRKVLLFKPAAAEKEITVPLKQLFPEGLELIQATVTNIESENKSLQYQDAEGHDKRISYDVLILAAGSIVRRPEPAQGGIALVGLEAAAQIRATWQANLRAAVQEKHEKIRQRLLSVVVAGAGISGIETSAELAFFIRSDAEQLGINPSEVKIMLINAHDRLFHEGPAKVGNKLEDALAKRGIKVIHQSKVLHDMNGIVTLSSGEQLSAGLCIWTLGLKPNPALHSLGVPLNSEGYVIVDSSYRVQGAQGLYSIGDCAHIVDPVNAKVDGKTCKEAIAQATRLSKIVFADLEGRPAPAHKRHMDFFCFSLGPDQGMAWTHQWGLDILITGKLGERIRQFTWDNASLLK